MSETQTAEIDTALRELMKFTPEQRMEIAERLLDSVNGFSSPEIEKAWLNEAQRRYEELKSGKESAIPVAQAIEDVKRELNERRQATSTGTSGPG